MNKILKRALMLGVALLAPSLAHAQNRDQQNHCDLSTGFETSCLDGPAGSLAWGQEFSPNQNNTIGMAVFVHNTASCPSGAGQAACQIANQITGTYTWSMCNVTQDCITSACNTVDVLGHSNCLSPASPLTFSVLGGQFLELQVFFPQYMLDPGYSGPHASGDYLEFQTTIDVGGDPSNSVLASLMDHATYTANGDEAFYYPPNGDINQIQGASPISDFQGGPAGEDIWFEEYYQPSATPEPASLVLLGTGLLGVIGVARRRRSK